MSSSVIASLALIAGALILAVHGLRGRQLGSRRMLMMAAVWVAIILSVVAIINLVESA